MKKSVSASCLTSYTSWSNWLISGYQENRKVFKNTTFVHFRKQLVSEYGMKHINLRGGNKQDATWSWSLFLQWELCAAHLQRNERLRVNNLKTIYKNTALFLTWFIDAIYLLLRMTQLINRNNTKSHRAKK